MAFADRTQEVGGSNPPSSIFRSSLHRDFIIGETELYLAGLLALHGACSLAVKGGHGHR